MIESGATQLQETALCPVRPSLGCIWTEANFAASDDQPAQPRNGQRFRRGFDEGFGDGP